MIAENKQRCSINVAGLGQTGPVAEDPRSIPEMVLDAVEQALAEAGIGFEEIDAVVTASVDLFDGLTASNIAVTEVVGAVMKPETHISADGLCAALHAACQLWSGAYETVLVVAHGKASMMEQDALTTWAMDPIYLQPLGVDFLTCAGLEACLMAAGDEDAEARWASTVVQRRRDAGERGVAAPCTLGQVLASGVVASPLRQEMCAPHADSACAVVLRRLEQKEDDSRNVLLTGIGHDLAPHAPGERDLSHWKGLRRACDRAYSMTNVADPATAFDLLEPSCRYPHEEELFLKACGARTTIRRSPGGGLFAGAAPVAAGLSRLVAAARWMRENLSAHRALVHGTWGPSGQGQAVVVLEAAG